MNILPVVGPLAIRIRSVPVALQFVFQFGVPFGKLFPIVGTSTIPKAVSRLSFVISWRAPRRNDFLAGCLLHRVGDLLICIRFFAAQIMFGLILIPLERSFSAIPCRIIFSCPPSWVFVLLFHNLICFFAFVLTVVKGQW